MVDEKPDQVYDWAAELIFSPDSQHVAYMAQQSGKFFVVVDGKRALPNSEFFSISKPVFSPDSQRVAYMARQFDKQIMVVVDGKYGPYFDDINGFIKFSPDSKRVAYMAVRNGNHFMVVDGKPGPAYDSIGTFFFSPDSKHVAYVAQQGK